MTLRKINARDLIAQVQAADLTTWLEVGGINSATVNPAENEEATDTTTYASAGAYESEVMQRGVSLKLEGFLQKDDVTGAPDPGQLRCETLAAAVAVASLGKFRFRHPVDTVWRVWNGATFSLSEQGGGNNDKTAWGCTVTRSGASSTAAVV